MKNLFALFFGVAFLVYPAFSQSVKTQKAVYAPGESIVVEFSGFPGNKQDWISIAQAGTADNSYITYQYTEGRQSGTIIFTGMQYGNYEIRGYFNNEYILRARYAFRIGNVDMKISVKTQQAVYKPGESIVVEFSGLPGNKQDWISIAQTGSADNSYIRYLHTEGRQSGTLTFDGMSYGDYEVRGYYNNEYTVRARYAFKVGNVAGNTLVKTQQPSYRTDEKILVEFAGFPGTSRIGLALPKPVLPIIPISFINIPRATRAASLVLRVYSQANMKCEAISTMNIRSGPEPVLQWASVPQSRALQKSFAVMNYPFFMQECIRWA